IAASNRILVEYQTLDERNQSRLMGVEGRLQLGNSGWSVGSTMLRETDQEILPGVDLAGSPGTRKQVAGLDATYTPMEGMQFSGEVAWSEDAIKKGQAVDVEGTWTAGVYAHSKMKVRGRYQQIASGFEGFERLDRGDREGRWGWQNETRRQDLREGEVGLSYALGPANVEAIWARRTGDGAGDRRKVQLQTPLMQYAYEHIGRGPKGGLTRQQGKLGGHLGPVQSHIRGSLETTTGEGVSRSSLFYASDPGGARLDGVRLSELAWDVSLGKRTWNLRTEIASRMIKQREAVWRDSLTALSFNQKASLDGKGWTVLGTYDQTVSHMGATVRIRRVTHLGRTRINFSRSGYSHELFYRASSAGVEIHQPVYVDVGRGLGTYVWEDVNGDGQKSAEEFVPDVDGNFEPVYNFAGAFFPVREGVMGLRLETDFGRLFKKSQGLLAGLSLDVSVQADRQTTSNAMGPWQLLGPDDGVDLQNASRDVGGRLHIFRHHKRGSLQISGRLRDRFDRSFYGGGRETRATAIFAGRLRFGREADMDGEVTRERRKRSGAEAFAFDILTYAGQWHGLWHPSNRWNLRLGMEAGSDYDRQRALAVRHVSLQPEMVRRLSGRGRARARVDLTQVVSSSSVPIFLGMAGGNRVGRNWIWRMGVDYRFGRYVTALVSYDGRKRPFLPVIHVGRMEMKAVF
ncbi:MAG: hypothetical protein O3B73_14150, partial [bacterium]|nr:hypothetical protein [bacterium]